MPPYGRSSSGNSSHDFAYSTTPHNSGPPFTFIKGAGEGALADFAVCGRGEIVGGRLPGRSAAEDIMLFDRIAAENINVLIALFIVVGFLGLLPQI